MKILLIEDSEQKRISIESAIKSQLTSAISQPNIIYAFNLTEARRQLISEQFDLIVFDMYLPDGTGSIHERDCSEELITEFSKGKNYKTEAIALTQFDISELENIQSFNVAGITLVKYDATENWKISLSHKIERISQRVNCDFLIFCALQKERNAFRDTDCIIGNTRKVSGLDCLEIKIGNAFGLIIKPQRMGLVNMAIVATKAIELFQPKIVAMSGICAGVAGETKYLDLVVGNTCWEYQTGKWKDGEFRQEPYQVSLVHDLGIDLNQTTENIDILNAVRKGLFYSELNDFSIIVAPISSGSAVIADEEMMSRIGTQQRKMAALEMEMYSLYEASQQSLCKPLYFGAKSVVDMGDASKGDHYHSAACLISARYVSIVLQNKLKEIL